MFVMYRFAELIPFVFACPRYIDSEIEQAYLVQPVND